MNADTRLYFHMIAVDGVFATCIEVTASPYHPPVQHQKSDAATSLSCCSSLKHIPSCTCGAYRKYIHFGCRDSQIWIASLAAKQLTTFHIRLNFSWSWYKMPYLCRDLFEILCSSDILANSLTQGSRAYYLQVIAAWVWLNVSSVSVSVYFGHRVNIPQTKLISRHLCWKCRSYNTVSTAYPAQF